MYKLEGSDIYSDMPTINIDYEAKRTEFAKVKNAVIDMIMANIAKFEPVMASEDGEKACTWADIEQAMEDADYSSQKKFESFLAGASELWMVYDSDYCTIIRRK